MNKGIRFALLVLFFGISSASAQVNKPLKFGQHFFLPGLRMSFSNNYVKSINEDNPNFLTLPFKEEHFTVYGGRVGLSAIKNDSTIIDQTSAGTFYFDTCARDKTAFPIAELQTRVYRNDTLLRDWQYIQKMPSFKDTNVMCLAAYHEQPLSYWLVNDSLHVGDSMLIELRRDSAAPLLRLHLHRENAYTQPFMMTNVHDEDHNELSFISNQLQQKSSLIYSSLFYHDWPGSGLTCNNQPILANSQMAFYFRRDNSESNDSIFLYRITGGRYRDTAWQKTDGLVLMTALSHNAHYKLEVKYADGHGKLSVYTFYTPPLWYQTTWFKVLLFAVAVALLLLGYFISRARENKRRIKYLQLEMQALHAQMNPHFLFNALSSIQGLMNDQQTDKANKYLSGFAALLRSAVSQGRKEFVPLSVELKDLNNYIELERLRFGFRYELDILPGLPADEITILPLLAQPLIENAAKHGLSGKRENGLLRLQITREQSDLLLYVTDNGNGFNPNNGGSGHGIPLTRERIALFNRMYKHRKIILDISSSASGTRCCFRFKTWLDND